MASLANAAYEAFVGTLEDKSGYPAWVDLKDVTRSNFINCVQHVQDGKAPRTTFERFAVAFLKNPKL